MRETPLLLPTFLKTSLQRFNRKFLLTLLGFAVAYVSNAATIFSNNVTGNWSSPASWSTNTVPGVGDVAIIAQGTITVDVATTAGAVQINGGTLKLNAGLTITNAWEYNSGTFTPNTQTVTFATGSTIGGTLPTTFRNVKISTTNSTDVVTLLTSGMNIQNSSGGGILTLERGIFKIGTGNVVNMIGGGGGNTINNPNPTGTSNFATTGTNGSDGGKIIFTSGNPVTINGPGQTTFFDLTSTSNPSFTITTAGTVLINGKVDIRTNSTGLHFAGSNSPIYGPASLLYIDNANQGYNPGLEWSASSGTIGVTPGYPNNVTLTNIGTSQGGFNNGNGWVPNITLGINGVFTLGDNVTNAQVDFSNVPSFTSGGFVLNQNSRFIAPKAVMTVKGSWTDNQAVSGNTKGFFINGTSTVIFAGSGTCGTPNTIKGPGANTETFNNLTVSDNVNLLSPVTVNASGFFSINTGILTTTTANILTINNSSTGAVAGGGATSYINGPLKWNVATAGNIYSFPVGSGTCTPDFLPISINKIAGVATTLTVQAFTPGSGGTVDGTLSSLSSTEYWSVTSGADLSGSTITQISRPTPIFPLSLIGKSNTTATGVYTSISGSPIANGINNTNDIGSGTTYFFSFAAAPIVSTLAPTSVTTTSATLQGAFNTQNASHPTSFNYGTTNGYGSTINTLHSPITSNSSVADSVSLTGLIANTEYHYVATDGTNSGSDVKFFTAPNPPTIAPATNLTGSGFTANWSAPATQGSAAFSYTVQISTDPTFATGVTEQTNVSSSAVSSPVTGLTSATTYYVRVKAVNETTSSAWSAVTSVTTNLVPTPPCTNNTSSDGATTFTALAPVIDGTVDPIWSNPPSNAITQVVLGNNNNTQTWKSMWTADSLYVLVQVTDASLISQPIGLGGVPVAGATTGTSGNYYEVDGIEFYLDPDNSHTHSYDGVNDVQLRFNLGATSLSGQSTGGTTQFVGTAFNRLAPLVDWKMVVTPTGYLLEAAIPWGKNALNPGAFLLPNNTYGTPTNGQVVGIDIGINDQDNAGGGRQAQVQWNGNSTGSYLYADQFKSVGLQICPEPPTVTTPTKTQITATSALLGATVVSSGKDGGVSSPLTTRGTAYSLFNPVYTNAQAEGGKTLGVYTDVRTGLAPQTKYYYVGYANNAGGLTGVSGVDSFYTLSALPTVQPTLSATTCSTITLNWNAITFPPANQATQTGYLVLRRQDGVNPTTTGISTRVATKQSDLPAGTTLVTTISSGATLTYNDASAVTGTSYNYLLVPFTWDGVATDSTYNYFTGASTITATATAPVIPTFAPVAAICPGGTLNPLPLTSTNNITGTWSPALNNNATTTYTFTPDANQCAATTTLQIVVNQGITPTFAPVAPICSGTALSPLPLTSTNNVTGTWSPALNNTATTTYTFTPTPGQCASTTTLQIVVNQSVTPTFASVAAICSGQTLNPLPITSTNNITGTWSPALNNTGTTTYTFTPAANQCAASTTLTITVNPSPTVNAGPDLSVVQNTPITITGTSSSSDATFTWSGNGLSTTSGLVTQAVVSQVGQNTYRLTATQGNCSAFDEMTLTVTSALPCLDPMKGFTPNGDGFNEKWIVFNDEDCYTKVQVDVYNRYGGLVYHSDKYANNWNGEYKGKPIPDATYYYVIKATDASGHTDVKTGNVTVIR